MKTERNLKKCKPRDYSIICTDDLSFIVDLAPQQIWQFKREEKKYRVERQNVRIRLEPEMFEKYFEEIEQGE